VIVDDRCAVRELAVKRDGRVVDQDVQGADLARSVGDARGACDVEDEEPRVTADLVDGGLPPPGVP